jgi:hypothetical protein
MRKLFLSFFIIFSLLPSLIYAQEKSVKLDYSGLVKCDGVITESEQDRKTECNFAALLQTVKSGINWLFAIAFPLVTVFMAYGGLLYMSGSQKNIATAKSIFTSASKGIIIMLIAWVSVITVVNWFVTEDTGKIIKTFINF